MTAYIPGLLPEIMANMADEYASKLSKLAMYLEVERHHRAVSAAFDESRMTSLKEVLNFRPSEKEAKKAVKQALRGLETQEAKLLTRPLFDLVESL